MNTLRKKTLLDTHTANFADVVGNGKTYAIPPYQRDYSWSEEQWEDLWNDVLEMTKRPDDRHYMGALVLEAKSDREFLVIDGQQRLATLSIFALVIIRRLLNLAERGVEPDANRERAETLRMQYIGAKNPASLLLVSKLTLNEIDNAFYQDYLVEFRDPLNPRGLPQSNRALWDCQKWLAKQLDLIAPQSDDGKFLAELLNETIARQLLFTLITVDDELNAYTIFETLNARGIDLSSTDLLKNYLFSRVRTMTDLAALQRRWRTLLQTVRQERFPEFLRYHLLCEMPKVRSNQLYKIVRERIQNTGNVFDLIKALEDRAERFAAVADVTHEFWIDHPECRPHIRERVLYRSQQSTPLLFAAWENFPRSEFAKLLRLINVFTFRFTTVGNLNTNLLEPLYHRAAKSVIDGDSTNAGDVFGVLREAYVDDEKFKQNFESWEIPTFGRGKRLARFVLCRLESDASGVDLDFETDSATIEHILPEHPTDEWIDLFDEKQFSQSVYRVGNLTLLEAKKNRQVGNAPFEQKLATYLSSRYVTTSRLAIDPPETWTPEQIALRQRQMARRAAHLWRV
ncbi:MAG: DUF262 domain-containing protein [Blastocatellia bacterium]